MTEIFVVIPFKEYESLSRQLSNYIQELDPFSA